MLLVLLEPVNCADFKYVCIVWIGSQIWEIFTADSQSGRFCSGFYLILFEWKMLCYFQSRPNSNAIWHGEMGGIKKYQLSSNSK